MTEQLTLDAASEVTVGRPSLEERWRLFKAEHPYALAEVARTTRELMAISGRRPTVAKVWEELRERVRTTGDPYRWDNSFRAFAAREVMDNHPDLAGVFRTRQSRADRGTNR